MNPLPPESDPALDRFGQLLTAALDDELTAAERAEFEELLAASPERQREWETTQHFHSIRTPMKFKDPPAETWDRYWLNVYNRLERRLAWILVSLGGMVLLAFAAYHLVGEILREVNMPWYIRLSLLGVLAGASILTVSVAREKWFTRKSDPYRKIQR